MLKPAIPPNEAERLATLHALRILDTPPEERYDRITRLACKLFDVPIAMVSLVDEHRQWFKSRQGVDVEETPREISFCGHAILKPETMIVPDATLDPRFEDNPVVVGEPHVRFYAGHPLSAIDGSALGTLCLVDRSPRTLGPDERQLLIDLAGLVEDELTLVEISELQVEMGRRREAEAAREESDRRFRIIFDAAAVGVALLDSRRCIIQANRRLVDLLAADPDDVVGARLSEFVSEDDVGTDAADFAELIAGRLDHYQVDKRLVRGDGGEFPAKLTISLVRREMGDSHHAIVIVNAVP